MRGEGMRDWSWRRFGQVGRVGAVGLLAVGVWASVGGPTVRAYTPEQVTAGQQVYSAVCIRCHGDRGQGGGADDPEAPLIIGARALTGFRDGQDLYDYVVEAMPNDEPGSLPAQDYWNVLAWLLAQNNLSSPGEPLGPATAAGVSMRR
jgi:mono/diheme cytochrome c family protein